MDMLKSMHMSDALTSDIRQEANAALLEVDKGLRASRVGEQCEAIVKFPSLVDRFPFPILINAAYLKLAEVFRTGINFLRLNILKVFQLTEKHLKKITSVDEVLRRIYSVIHSNDPVARAVTLRVFGSIASIIAERKNVHHSVHQGLESNDQVEVEAAIYATSCLCKHSSTFATGVCEKIANMVQGLTTPVGMKLRLIPILTLMQHDISTATQVRELCLKLLPSYPSLSFVTAILETLTELAIATLVHVPEQVKLLLFHAQSDSRRAVRLMALRQLHRITFKVPHTWTKEMIQGLISVSEKAGSEREKELGALALYKLSGSLAIHNITPLKDDLLHYCYSSNAIVAAYTMGVVSNITMATSRVSGQGVGGGAGVCEESEDLVVEVGSMVIESMLLMDFEEFCRLEDSPLKQVPFKVMLSILVQCAAVSSEVSRTALDTLLSILSMLPGVQAAMVCQALVSIATHTLGSWEHVAPELLKYLKSKTEVHDEVLLPVSAVLMQLHAGEASAAQRQHFHSTILPQLLSHLWGVQHHKSPFWLAYKMARRASMMGFHELAVPIYFKLSNIVTTVKFRNWLSALHQLSLAQTLISSPTSPSTTFELIPALCEASAIVYNAMLLTKASSTPSSFPLKFLTVHAAWLNAHCQLLTTCVSFHTVPSPALSVGRDLEKKFRQCMLRFQSLSEQYSDLYSSMFDADPSSLQYITLLQQSCLLMASVISSITLSKKPLVSPGRVSTPVAETPIAQVEIADNFNTSYLLGKACRTIFQNTQVAASTLQSLPISEEHISVLNECSKTLLQVPVRLPRYFFVSLQKTTVKLALSPPLPSPGQHVTVFLNTHLTLKVEGIVEHSGKDKVYRSPSAVYVQVKPKLEKLLAHDLKPPELQQLERVEPVEKDYFLAQFVLTVPVSGYYTVQIEASLLDNEGTVWHTGHKANMTLLVESEENLKQQQRQREAVLQQTMKINSAGGHGHRSL